MRALTAPGGRPDFMPSELAKLAEKPRDRIWELADNLHCSIVGTCLTNSEARGLLTKLGRPDARTISEHRLHGEIVQIAGRRDGGGKLLQKALDRRHESEIQRFDGARTADEVRALWRASLERGEIPGAYWAAITHPATDRPLVQDIFGEVHMLSHLVGQSNRADIRRLRKLESDLAERDEVIKQYERRNTDLMAKRDALAARVRLSAEPPCAQLTTSVADERMNEQASIRMLETRLVREQAHAEALEEKVGILHQAASRLGADLEAALTNCRTLEGVVLALETSLAAHLNTDEEPQASAESVLVGRTLLYVGGRPRQVATLRRFAEGRGGHLLSHDGGIEESLSLLPGLIGRSGLVLFPVDCVSHEAVGLIKRHCQVYGRDYVPLRSASLASFIQALMPSNGIHVRENAM